MNRGKLFIISAPSGAGKTSLVKELVESQQDIVVSISHTTRKIRPGEENGKDYFFVSEAKFKEMINENEFIEYAKVFDHYYGTSHSSVLDQLQDNLKVILEIDWQGAAQVRKRFEDAKSIFILPPSKAELEKRLRSRGQDSDEIITRRMCDAESEMSHYHEFDHIVMNDDFKQALSDLSAIVIGTGQFQPISEDNLSMLMSELLSES